MLDVTCDPCGGRVLIGSRQIVSLRHTEAGIEVGYVCHCGRVGMRLTGRAASRRVPAAAVGSGAPCGAGDEPAT